jgi:hypothetical protein
MKNTTFSLEGIALIALLVIGLFGAKMVLKSNPEQSEQIIPRQETPAMVIAPQNEANAAVWGDN